LTASGPSILSPLTNTRLYEVVQVQDPVFLSRQVFIKVSPEEKIIPSGTVTSATKEAWSQLRCAVGGPGVWVGATDGVMEGVRVGVFVAVDVGVSEGVRVGVGVFVLVGLGVSVAVGVTVGGSITFILTQIV
jgi:hypothetical protein